MELALAAAAVVAGLGAETRLFAPGREPRRGEAAAWAAGWLLLAVAVAAAIGLAAGPAGEWTTVYLIERSLSLDNVFLFSLLLAYFAVPSELRGRVIVIGIAGALLLRGVAIAAGLALVESIEAVVYAFGVLLLYVAYRTFRGAAEEADPSTTPVLRLVRRAVPDDNRLPRPAAAHPRGGAPIRHAAAAGGRCDRRCRHRLRRRLDPGDLGKTVALILAFVGIKILADDLVHISDLASLGVIAALLAGGVATSVVADRLDPPHPTEEATRRPPRCPERLAAPEGATASDEAAVAPVANPRGKTR